MIALIDADQVAFACAAAAEKHPVEQACHNAEGMINNILQAVNATGHELWLSGGFNFRYSVYPEYKAGRKTAYRPKWEHETKQFLVDYFGAQRTDGIEADDMLGIRQHELCFGEGTWINNSIICHMDKDLDQIEGEHYNWELRRLGEVIREPRRYSVTSEEADRFFYYQLIVGDSVDNIKGAVGSGKKAAKTLLDNLPPSEWYSAVRDLFSCEEELDLNAQCVYIWRKRGDSWRNLIAGLD